VLGIDNLIFISILVERLPPQRQNRARIYGLALAMVTRVGLLFSVVWLTHLVTPLFEVAGQGVSGRDLVLLGGGMFLLAKSTFEIHGSLEGESEGASRRAAASFFAVIVQILLLDIVFSLDSVITAVGMANEAWVMITAIVLAVLVMLVAAEPISAFVERHPTIKMLALSFLLLIGLSLVADGFGQHISKGYLYFAMGFSVFVEMINLRVRAKSHPVELRRQRAREE
jgi:predicted tellurium resistance membrane protein TerC